ncbi:GNAT family protein [Roseiarcaceae bacterium H3SJ34-1]|uniref:GNAT family N-acetyltransferase n=1 Tax=Terripilifer ovatus TaxID=3032367 RepID=UPI003AB91CA3|nr:GNAT family protein [Roseiarcaceae bacterium H3SJ34-1]
MEASDETLQGRYVTLERLASRHAPALAAALKDVDIGELGRYVVEPPLCDPTAFAAMIAERATATSRRYYACVPLGADGACGYLALIRDEPAHRSIEIGDVFYAPALQHTRAGTEAVYLLARYAFETMGYRRLEWKCDDLNAPSRQAALRYGFTFEGVFRQHMLVRGNNRDTAWFSMLDGEWPARRAAFEAWLDPANFDASGRQRVALSALNGIGSI